jgi:hypothetical protein
MAYPTATPTTLKASHLVIAHQPAVSNVLLAAISDGQTFGNWEYLAMLERMRKFTRGN